MDRYGIGIFYDEVDGGDTPEDALREIQIAKQLWLDVAKDHGDPIPEPRWRPDERARAG